MNKNSRRLGLYMLLMLLIATAAVALRTLACINNMEGNLIYFGDETLAFASGVTVVAGVALLLTSAAVLHKVPLRASFSSPLTYIPTAAVCVALVSLIFVLWGDAATITSYLSFKYAVREPLFILNVVSALLGALSVAHFILTALLTERHRQLRAYFALGTILFVCFYTALLYFENTMPINAPTEIVDEMAYLSAAIFFLYEARISLGREMWRGYSAFGLVAALLTAYASIPELLAYFISGKILALSLESSILLFTIFIFIFSRLVITATTREDGEHKSIIVLREFAERREAELAEVTRLRRGIEDIQISIDDILGEPIEVIHSEQSVPDEKEAEEPASDEVTSDEAHVDEAHAYDVPEDTVE